MRASVATSPATTMASPAKAVAPVSRMAPRISWAKAGLAVRVSVLVRSCPANDLTYFRSWFGEPTWGSCAASVRDQTDARFLLLGS